MDQRNLIMAIIASVTILLGWQFLYEQPRIEKQAAIKKNTQIQNKIKVRSLKIALVVVSIP